MDSREALVALNLIENIERVRACLLLEHFAASSVVIRRVDSMVLVKTAVKQLAARK